MATIMPTAGTIFDWTLIFQPERTLAQLRRTGFDILDAVKGADSIVIRACLPAHWYLIPDELTSYVTLFDDRGRERAVIIPHDSDGAQWSSLHLRTRFWSCISPQELYDNGTAIFQVKDRNDGSDIFTSQRYVVGDEGRDQMDQYYRALDEIRDWLGLHYPDWRDFSAYWD